MNDETVDVGEVTVGEALDTHRIADEMDGSASDEESGSALPERDPDPNAGQRRLMISAARRLGNRLAAEIITDAIGGRKHCFQPWFEGLSYPNRVAVLNSLITIKDNHETMSL